MAKQKKIQKIVNNVQATDSEKENYKNSEKIYFKMKELDGDQSIWLGQTILALIQVNRNPLYEKHEKSFTVELFTSLMEELEITPDDITREIYKRNNPEE